MLSLMGQPSADRIRFGQIVRTWRKSQKPIWSQDFVKSRGGPSDTTQTRVERAEGPEPNLDTFQKYDIAFEWEPGTAARIYAGAEPPSLAHDAAQTDTAQTEITPARSPALLSTGIGTVAVEMNLFTALVRTYSELRWAVQSEADRAAEAAGSADGGRFFDDVVAVLEQQKTVIEKVTRVWLTEMLERHAGPGLPVPEYLELGHGEQLNRPVSADDPDAEDKLYLRWLAHRDTGDVPDALQETFLRRYQRKVSELTSSLDEVRT